MRDQRHLALQLARWLPTSIVVAFVLGTAMLFVLPRLLGMELLAVRSGSMSPTIRTGEMIMVWPTAPDRIEAGDIIAFRMPNADAPVTHRVVAKEGNGTGILFRTKGDANHTPDPGRVPAADVIGVVKAHVPLIGYFAHYVRTPMGFVLALAAAAAMVAATQAGAIVAHRRRAKESV